MVRIEFVATESGFDRGFGGVGNSNSNAPYHYILFGLQYDNQTPDQNGIYFEFDDQINGTVNQVTIIKVGNRKVNFDLKHGGKISVTQGISDEDWKAFATEINRVFPEAIIEKN
jgi:hypothetical protein